MKKKVLTISLISILSILLWVFVSFSEDYFTTLEVPVEFNNVPKGYLVTTSAGEKISITIKGQGWILGQITFGRSPKFLVDIKGEKGQFVIQPKNFVEKNRWLSSNLQIIEISPSQFRVNVVKAYTKEVKVNPKFKYSLDKDYAFVSDVSIVPEKVFIKGPKKLLKKIQGINTVAEKFTGISESFQTEVPLEKIKFVKVVPKVVRVNFQVDKIADKTFFGVSVKTKYIPRNQSLEVVPPKIDVTLRGALKLLAAYSDSNITAYVTFKQALRDTVGTIEPTLVIPPFTELLMKQPKRLKYVIKKY